MNVAEIRQRIFDQMDYFPDLQQYRDSVVRRMNERYQEICDSAHWLFLQKEINLQLRKDIVATTATYDAATNNIELVVDGTNKRKVSAASGGDLNFTFQMQGALLVIGTAEYRIVGVQSTSVFFIEPIEGAAELTAAATHKDFEIKFDRYRLPQDCIEVLGFMDREADRGRLLYVDRRREEFAYLDKDNKGDPSVAIDDDFILDEPPINTPTAVSSAGSGNLVSGNTYEYKYTIWREGRESPPSLKVQVTLGSTHNTVAVANIDNTGWFDSYPTQRDSGAIKFIYRRDVTLDTKWILIDALTSTETTKSDEAVQPNIAFGGYPFDTTFKYLSQNDVERWEDAGPAQYIRFWFKSDTDRKLNIRYHFRPKDLVADNDAPQWPRQYHMLVVHLVLQDMFLQMQDTVQAQLFERRANIVLEQMRRRYLSRDDVKKKFMRFDTSRRFRNIYGPPSIN